MGARGVPPARLELTPDERATPERWSAGRAGGARRRRLPSAPASCSPVLACADRPDVAHGQRAEELGVHRATVGTWRQRFAARRLDGLKG